MVKGSGVSPNPGDVLEHMRVYPDMPTRRREPNPMTCVSMPWHVRSVLLAHAVGDPDLAVVLKGFCVLEQVRAVDARGGSSAGAGGMSDAVVAARGQRHGGSDAVGSLIALRRDHKYSFDGTQ